LKKKILIVGGTGFIGYHLAKKCLKLNWIIHSISTKKPKKKRFLKNINYILCDISNKNLLKKKIKIKYNYVVNLGGYVNHNAKKKTYESHFTGCKNLSEIFLKNKVDTFLQIGSSSEYGKSKSPLSEKNKCSPSSKYGKAKLLATSYLINLFKKNNFPCVVLRLFQVYGPYQDYNRFIPFIIKSCLNNAEFDCSDGNQFRDFIYVDDVVNVIIKALKNKKSKGKIINIGNGKSQKIGETIEKLRKKLHGGKPNYGAIKLRKDEMIDATPNLNLSKSILNWNAKVNFDKGLKKTINYIRKNL